MMGGGALRSKYKSEPPNFDKNSLFWGRGIGYFALCVKGKVNALCGNPSF